MTSSLLLLPRSPFEAKARVIPRGAPVAPGRSGTIDREGETRPRCGVRALSSRLQRQPVSGRSRLGASPAGCSLAHGFSSLRRKQQAAACRPGFPCGGLWERGSSSLRRPAVALSGRCSGASVPHRFGPGESATRSQCSPRRILPVMGGLRVFQVQQDRGPRMRGSDPWRILVENDFLMDNSRDEADNLTLRRKPNRARPGAVPVSRA